MRWNIVIAINTALRHFTLFLKTDLNTLTIKQ